MYDWGYNDNGYGVWGFVFMLLIMALVVIGVIVAIRYLGSHAGASGSQKETALDILQKRYASGEIDKSEYEEKRRALSK